MPAQDCTPMLKALADENRWRLVKLLLAQEQGNVSELVESMGIPQPNVSKHLRILRLAGIVSSRKEGTVVWYSVVPEFRRRVQDGGMVLDLGCCSFQFAEEGAMGKPPSGCC